MFKRLIFDTWVGLFPLISFITASTVFVSITWKALRMRPADLDRMSRLPIDDLSRDPNEDAR